MNNNEDVSRLVDNLKELNNELEKMNKNFQESILQGVDSSFDILSKSANSLTESISLVVENQNYLGSGFMKLIPNVAELSNIFGGVVGTFASFCNIIPMVELGFEVASIAVEALNEALRDKSMDAYYESCIKVSEELGNFAEGIENAITMFDGFKDKTLLTTNAVRIRTETMLQYEEMTVEKMQELMHAAEEIRDQEIKNIVENYHEQRTVIEKEEYEKNQMISDKGQERLNQLKKDTDNAILLAEENNKTTMNILYNWYIQQSEFYDNCISKRKQYNQDEQDEVERHKKRIAEIEKDAQLSSVQKSLEKIDEEILHSRKKNQIRDEYYKSLVSGNEKEIGALVTLTMETIKYGGTISDETELFILDIIDSWDSLSEETKDTMKNVFSPMIDEMEKMLPKLEDKAAKIANAIIKKFNTVFKISSPSKKTREIFRFLMEGCELGLEDEKNNLLGITDDISGSVLDRLSCVRDMHSAVMGSSIGRMNSASVNESNLSVMNRIAQSRGVIQTVLNIDGREFAVATSGYMKEEMAFIR